MTSFKTIWLVLAFKDLLFSSKSFVALYFVFKSVIHSELIFYIYLGRIFFFNIFFLWKSNWSNTSLLKESVFLPVNCFCIFVKNHLE